MSAYDVDSSEVSVDVKDGKVTLEGTVPDRRMKHAIEDIADRCSGVQDIENKVRVSRESSGSEWSTGTGRTGFGQTGTPGGVSSRGK